MLFGNVEKLNRLQQEIRLLRQDRVAMDRHLDEIRVRAEGHAAERCTITASARMEEASVLVLRNLETLAASGERTPSAPCVGKS